MMRIQLASPWAPAAGRMGKDTGSDPQIRALENKLQQLNNEKKEAQKAHAEKKVRELEREIQSTEQKLEQLKKKAAQREEQQERQARMEAERQGQTPDGQEGYGPMVQDPSLGALVDRLA